MSKYARYHARRRQRLLRRLGEVCRECGARDDVQVAHLLGDGYEHRLVRGSAGVVTHLLSMPDSDLHAYVALLCRPCHVRFDLANGSLEWRSHVNLAHA